MGVERMNYTDFAALWNYDHSLPGLIERMHTQIRYAADPNWHGFQDAERAGLLARDVFREARRVGLLDEYEHDARRAA
jgi:hypothetical protein